MIRKSNNFFPEERAKQLIAEMNDNIPSDELIKIYYDFLNHLINKSQYIGYTNDLQEDMKSWAIYEWLKYGWRFDVNKGRVFTFWTRNAENSFKLVLKKHYRHKNIEKMIVDTISSRPDMAMLIDCDHFDLAKYEVDI